MYPTMYLKQQYIIPWLDLAPEFGNNSTLKYIKYSPHY